MCHELCDHSTQSTAATDTGFRNHKSAPQAHICPTEKEEIQKTIFAPKAHLHSSAKSTVPWFLHVRAFDRSDGASERPNGLEHRPSDRRNRFLALPHNHLDKFSAENPRPMTSATTLLRQLRRRTRVLEITNVRRRRTFRDRKK